MSIVVGNKVFDQTGAGDFEVIAAYKVRGEVVFGGVRASVTVNNRHGDAVRVRFAVRLSHADCGRRRPGAGGRRAQSRSNVGNPVNPSPMPYNSTHSDEERAGWSAV